MLQVPSALTDIYNISHPIYYLACHRASALLRADLVTTTLPAVQPEILGAGCLVALL